MAKSKTSNSVIEPMRIPVVGIGASAGGLESLRDFFDAVPPDLGVAYVVVIHLARDHESDLAPILARCTEMPVTAVVDHQRLPLEPNCVYVIAPDRKLEIQNGTVGAGALQEPTGRRSAIDVFFNSLASVESDAYAIILSGGGSDGTLGAKTVKEAGGLVLVQDPHEAMHEGMPRAVIAA